MINKLVFENLRHRWLRTALSAIVIGVQVTLLLTIVGLSQGMLADSANRARAVGADIWVKPENAGSFTLASAQINEKFVKLIEQQPHIRMAMGVIISPIFGFTSMAGVDLDKFVEINGGFRYVSGGPLKNRDDILIDEYYAREHKAKVGETITLLNKPWHIAGIVQEAKLSHIIADKSWLQELTSNTGRVSQIVVKLDSPDNKKVAIDQLNAKLAGNNLRAFSIDELASLYSLNNFPQLKTFIDVVIGLSICIGFLVVFLSMYTAVLERTREIGVLKALGAKPVTILNILLRETIVLAIIGSIFGILLSFAVRNLLMALIPASLPVVDVPDWWPISTSIAIGGALLGALYPGIKAARQDAIEALAYD